MNHYAVDFIYTERLYLVYVCKFIANCGILFRFLVMYIVNNIESFLIIQSSNRKIQTETYLFR